MVTIAQGFGVRSRYIWQKDNDNNQIQTEAKLCRTHHYGGWGWLIFISADLFKRVKSMNED